MSERVIVTDMDGTLTAAEMWRGVIDWLTEHRPTRATRWFVRIRLPILIAVRLGLYDRDRFRAGWIRDLARLLEGLDEAEVAEMSDWVVDRVLWPARRQEGLDAVDAARAEAATTGPPAEVVVATGAFQPVADGFARLVGAAHALGTPLEVRDGRATGRLSAHVLNGEEKAAAVRGHAAGREIVVAFGDTAADIPMLALASRAVAVAPDPALRRAAAARGWTIVEAG